MIITQGPVQATFPPMIPAQSNGQEPRLFPGRFLSFVRHRFKSSNGYPSHPLCKRWSTGDEYGFSQAISPLFAVFLTLLSAHV